MSTLDEKMPRQGIVRGSALCGLPFSPYVRAGDVIYVSGTTTYLTDMNRLADVNRPYRTVLDAGWPARACVEVSCLPDPQAQVEVDVVAYRRVA